MITSTTSTGSGHCKLLGWVLLQYLQLTYGHNIGIDDRYHKTFGTQAYQDRKQDWELQAIKAKID